MQHDYSLIMKLDKQTRQGKLIYFNHLPQMMAIYENQHFRWLNFADITQSIMNKRVPWQLTLPHQVALLMPALFVPLTTVIEIGLGGGNLLRWLSKINNKLHFVSIENNHTVYECFEQYFNPNQLKFAQFNNEFTLYLQQNTLDRNWVIYDIFERIDSDSIALLSVFLSQINQNNQARCISLNIPQSTEYENDIIQKLLQPFSRQYFIYKLEVPHYQNVIYHIIDKSLNHANALEKESPTNLIVNPNNLPNYQYQRWLMYWQHSNQIFI